MRFRSIQIATLTAMLTLAGCDSGFSWTPHSDIPRAFDADGPLMRAGSSQGIDLSTRGGVASGGGGTTEVHRHCIAVIRTGTATQLMRAFQNEIKRLIEAEGGTICGNGESGGPDDLRSFSYDYNWGRNRGIIRVQSFVDTNGKIEINALAYEHRL